MELENLEKIAVFRALQLGDMLCAVPALRALRAACPHAEITLIGLPWAASFVDRFSTYLDSFICFPGYPGLPEQVFNRHQWPAFVNLVNGENFNIILQMQGNGTIVNRMLKEFFPTLLAGFHSEGSLMDPEFFLTYPDDISEIERHLKLMNHLGVPSKGKDLEFPVSNDEIMELERLTQPFSSKKYVCIHPGSSVAWRQWPVEHFAALADELSRLGYAIVITGTEKETEIAHRLTAHMKNQAVDFTGKTRLGQAGQLIRNALMLISNCTGVSHIAAATRTPSIVISMDGEPQRWGPLDKKLHRTIDWASEQDFEQVRKEMYGLLSDLEV